PLRLGQMIQDDHGDLGHPEFPGSEQAGVAGDNDSIGAGKYGVGPPELGYRGRDLGYLVVTMRARIPGVRNELLDRPRYHLQVRHALLGWVGFWNRPSALCRSTILAIIGTTTATSLSQLNCFAR